MINIQVFYLASVIITMIVYIIFKHIRFFAVKKHIEDNNINVASANYIDMVTGILQSPYFFISFIPALNIIINGYLIVELKYFISELKAQIDYVDDLYYKEVKND